MHSIGADHCLSPCSATSPHPPRPPWQPCHVVMWSPPVKRQARQPHAADGEEPPSTDRPYFYGVLSDLTIAPDIYTYHRDNDNLMQYRVALGTEKLLTTALLAQNRLTLTAPQPAVIPRWFAPGYAHQEAAERATIIEAQHIRHAPADDIRHPDWITRTSLPAPSRQQTSPSTQPSAPTPHHRLQCFRLITGDAEPRLALPAAPPNAAQAPRGSHPMQTRHAPNTRSHTPHRPPQTRSHQRHAQTQTSRADAERYRACWEQLCHNNIRKADVDIAWLALHCSLRTPSLVTSRLYSGGAIITRSGDSPMQQACCRWPACRVVNPRDAATTIPHAIANTSHVLLYCPLTMPAAQWICDVWAAIDDGNAPPATPDVIIAGDPLAWRPRRLHVDLWTRIRALYLHHAWAAHCVVRDGGPPPSPTSIAAATLHAAVRAMRTEFTAAYTAPTELAQQCQAHMTGAQQRQSLHDEGDGPQQAFARVWTDSGLCTVTAGQLDLHWTATHPVPLPAASPVPPMPAQPPNAASAVHLPRLHLIPSSDDDDVNLPPT